MATHLLEPKLGLTFRDPELLQQALVHRSYVNEQGGKPGDSYERMEFLGDAVLELTISTQLYQLLPGHAEGELTKGRASLVCRESLARVARHLGLGDFILLGKGEEANGGRERDSTLAAAMESVVAAVYLDQGFLQAQRFVLRAMSQELEGYLRQGSAPGNPKSLFQEMVQRQGSPTPRYRLASSQGPDHEPVFTVEVVVDDKVMGQGQGSKKSEAERVAAQDALDHYVLEGLDAP